MLAATILALPVFLLALRERPDLGFERQRLRNTARTVARAVLFKLQLLGAVSFEAAQGYPFDEQKKTRLRSHLSA